MKMIHSNNQPKLFAQVVYHKNKWLSSASKALINLLLSSKTEHLNTLVSKGHL
ncbi:hypothetical protein SM124_11395 [Bacillus sp. 31A1R]|uniref:Uncharacterized protein n=1 Tax=Robertmurraya mangrovi TaxID=3098077 RepID=A0ABU5IYZ3_9BACI|nr:hypothetical protein [Bacillus sp. 31A1R]MDZ5472352.1 hypothetical protein [Bacillus sp. 31A1R]